LDLSPCRFLLPWFSRWQRVSLALSVSGVCRCLPLSPDRKCLPVSPCVNRRYSSLCLWACGPFAILPFGIINNTAGLVSCPDSFSPPVSLPRHPFRFLSASSLQLLPSLTFYTSTLHQHRLSRFIERGAVRSRKPSPNPRTTPHERLLYSFLWIMVRLGVCL